MSADPASDSVRPPPEVLHPDLLLLRQEYVLVQAWKKTASYIRRHNWYSDPLELDWITIHLREFLGDLSSTLKDPRTWKSEPLRLVPAPKSQTWSAAGESWQPVSPRGLQGIRPLAHATVRDQVVATALLLCLADRVETEQRDPNQDPRKAAARELTSSYGNRLFCTPEKGELRHRWGSVKLYRSFFTDYRTFVGRPTVYADTQTGDPSVSHFLVTADLRQFYDRVRPEHLHMALRRLERESDDPDFFDFAARVLSWRWDRADLPVVDDYARKNEIDGLRTVALPQGLVAAGFFANVVLLDFDEAMRKSIGKTLPSSITLREYYRYVDDLCVLVSCPKSVKADVVQNAVVNFLSETLRGKCSFLSLSRSDEKGPAIAEIGGEQLPLVRQSARMNRIQAAVSGGFGAVEGAQILSSIFALVRSQQALSPKAGRSRKQEDIVWDLRPLPDVRDDTARRFAAGRFRTTFRSLRPLLHKSEVATPAEFVDDDRPNLANRHTLTQTGLDAEARMFSLHLVDRWIADPSQVRLLRIGLDVWPHQRLLKTVLTFLRPLVVRKSGRRSAKRLVGCYCLAELFRAGATETGFVFDNDRLPQEVDIEAYRARLAKEAGSLLPVRASLLPWYVRHQAVLYLAVFRPDALSGLRPDWVAGAPHYQVVASHFARLPPPRQRDHATLAIWLRRALGQRPIYGHLPSGARSVATRREIARLDPSFAHELFRDDPSFAAGLSLEFRTDVGVAGTSASRTSLAHRVRVEPANSASLSNELTLLRFSRSFLRMAKDGLPPVVAPHQVILDPRETKGLVVREILPHHEGLSVDSRYRPPDWCPANDRWRFQLGFLLRFVLTRNSDFTQALADWSSTRPDAVYRPVSSHWYQRLHGSYNGQEAFGGDWIPITDWFEGFLRALLHWPGAVVEHRFRLVESHMTYAISRVESRIEELKSMQRAKSGVLVLPFRVQIPRDQEEPRRLNICVVQTTVPDIRTFQSAADLTLSDPKVRQKHRNHLSSALAAVRSMMEFQGTAHPKCGPPDLLILPELAVHPLDVRSHLLPFARAHGVTILTGVTYQELFGPGELVNSALWVVPEYSAARGMQARVLRQGKKHLSPGEEALSAKKGKIVGFRPCQWVLEYPIWRGQSMSLTAAVCYDATDLKLAEDLRGVTDGLLVPALNKNVALFDNLAETLNYHMYQMLVVANNGVFGGSSAYWPSSHRHHRRIFHLHGARQTSIAFVQIGHKRLRAFLGRPGKGFQTPPAGWRR